MRNLLAYCPSVVNCALAVTRNVVVNDLPCEQLLPSILSSTTIGNGSSRSTSEWLPIVFVNEEVGKRSFIFLLRCKYNHSMGEFCDSSLLPACSQSNSI